MNDWNPTLYLQFERERTQPARDLAARIEIDAPHSIVDLGCGPGNSTRVLQERWPGSEICGIDCSAEMIAQAEATQPEGEWMVADIAEWKPERKCDIIFSNAALQWVPDHLELLPLWTESLSPGGVLAWQMPYHEHSALHQRVVAISQRPQWRDKLESARHALTIHRAEIYDDVLRPHCHRLELWRTIYFHRMENGEAILSWIRSTGLRPYLEALDAEEREEFLDQLRRELKDAYPSQSGGYILFPFERLFVIAYRR